jgi:hypothetical protein
MSANAAEHLDVVRARDGELHGRKGPARDLSFDQILAENSGQDS